MVAFLNTYYEKCKLCGEGSKKYFVPYTTVKYYFE